jgi:flagellar motor switch protein FliN
MSDDSMLDDNMTPEEREMMRALEDADAAPAAPKPPPAPSPKPEPQAEVQAHPVDVAPLKAAPLAAPDSDGNLKMIMDIPVEIKVEVGNSRLTIREILNLSPGAIIELDRTAGSPADIIVNGTTVGQGDVVIVEESYGIRITKLVTPEDRLNSL